MDQGNDTKPEKTPVWVLIEGGEIFNGSWQNFVDNEYDTVAEARAWCEQNGWKLELLDYVPAANGLPIPVTFNELGAALREYATRARNAGIDQAVTDHLWKMADAVDFGSGPVVHHGCPDPSIPTAQCVECRIVLEVEVDNGAGRDGTVFDSALTTP